MIHTAILYAASFIGTYQYEICFGITAVTLMLFGPAINGGVRRLTRKLHWVVRYSIFVLLCTAGYIFLSQALYRGVRSLLLSCGGSLRVAVTVGIFLALAWVAKEQKAI